MLPAPRTAVALSAAVVVAAFAGCGKSAATTTANDGHNSDAVAVLSEHDDDNPTAVTPTPDQDQDRDRREDEPRRREQALTTGQYTRLDDIAIRTYDVMQAAFDAMGAGDTADVFDELQRLEEAATAVKPHDPSRGRQALREAIADAQFAIAGSDPAGLADQVRALWDARDALADDLGGPGAPP